jgi:3-hydroxyisobutyrate dehydrogenase-like beta-hydroxyacid dehydrogenase
MSRAGRAIVSGTIAGLLHPGEMGAAVGRCLTGRGYTVLWASQGRGPATAERAAAAGLTDVGDVAAVAARAGVILSICPPHAARDVAGAVAGYRGIFVDANAISPQTAREVAGIVGHGGAFADGGIIGPPPEPGPGPGSGGGTRLYLSGDRAEQVRDLFAGTAVDARIVEGGAGAASAVKMAYAAWTKGTAALLLAARALARAEDVEDTLLAEWALSQPGLAERTVSAARSAAAKGWRWEAEMTEIAASMAAAGLPDGFHLAAAEIFRHSPRVSPAAADAAGDGGPGAADGVDRVLTALSRPAAAPPDTPPACRSRSGPAASSHAP